MICRLTWRLYACGRFKSLIPESSGERLPLRLLQARQLATRLSQVESPPRDRGTIWSRVRSCGGKVLAQYWHMLWSLRSIFFRERLLRSNGMWMYSINRITEGIGIENRDEWIHPGELSSASATPFKIRITARRAVHTLIGSKDAFNTKTREFILSLDYSVEVRALSKVLGNLGNPGAIKTGTRRIIPVGVAFRWLSISSQAEL
jgi:hypothetical protein